MTQEQKAKAYDEALEWMREIYPTMEGFVKEDAEHYFPELKESDDERVKKTITDSVFYQYGAGVEYKDVLDYLDKLEKQKEPKHDATDAKSERVIKAARSVLNNWLDGTDCPDVSGAFVELEYAIREYDGEEKQKESLHIQETCKENADSFTDEDERIREFLIDLLSHGTWKKDWPFSPAECVAYLEKQKENPKSADSIPSDCISDAKCEDRWHKVNDSLPDNPREVLCKDEAGNYFIGRYYVGEGWDISNYDDEDKPHHLNPPVSKWIDFPSEKQKEQKPVEIHIDNPNIEKFDPDVKITTSDSSADGDELLYVCNKSYKIGYRDGKRDAERKPAEWSEIELEFRGEKVKVKRQFFRDDNGRGYSTTEQDEDVAWNALRAWCEKKGISLYDLYPKEWSEEDEKKIEEVISDLCTLKDWNKKYDSNWLANPAFENIDKRINWLKSLRPSWKPSEEQIYSLGTVVKGYNECTVGSVGYNLKELYNNLKTLM